MTAVYYGRSEIMEGYEIYRLSEDEIQHFGVKGMKWGKRKSRSSYMKKVDAHEAKTSARRDAKKAASKAKYEQEKADFANGKKAVKQAGKNYIERNKAKEVARLEKRVETKAKFKNDVKTTVKKMRDASEMIEAESQAKRDAKKAASKAKYEQEKSDFKQVKDKIAVKKLAKARAKDLSEKLSKGLNIAVAVNDVYGDISPTGLKNHFANAEQLEKYGIEYNP